MRTKVLLALAVAALTLPASASAQATRTWVSGVGDDANPCARTSPCKTFAGAISKTAAGGEINCLDPGGFGGVTIGKSLTIKCQYTEGGVLVSGTNAIVVNAASTDKVVLRGLDVNGLGTGLVGIKVLSAASVKVLDSEVYGFTGWGIASVPTGALSKLIVHNTHIHDNASAGVMVSVGNNLGLGRAAIRRNQIDDNGCGIAASSVGTNSSSGNGGNCGIGSTTSGISAAVAVNAMDNDISDSAANGVVSNGSLSTVRVGRNTITGSIGPALSATNGGSLLSFQNNTVVGNPGGNGASTGTVTFTRHTRHHRLRR